MTEILALLLFDHVETQIMSIVNPLLPEVNPLHLSISTRFFRIALHLISLKKLDGNEKYF